MDDKCGIFYFGVIIGENCCIGQGVVVFVWVFYVVVGEGNLCG